MRGLPTCGSWVGPGPPLLAAAPRSGSPGPWWSPEAVLVNPQLVSLLQFQPFEIVGGPVSTQLAPPFPRATTEPKEVSTLELSMLAPVWAWLPAIVTYTSTVPTAAWLDTGPRSCLPDGP
ncbi:MAG TPA: hypothetical protein VIX84_15235, partial [Acidimicrobiales bacterium]